MTSFKRASLTLMIGCAAGALGACGASDIASPGEGVIVTPPTAPAPSPSPTPTPGGGLVTPAAQCPQIAGPNPLGDQGTISGPTGTWRVCQFPARFTQTTTIPKVPGVLYSLGAGRVDVGTDQGPASTGNQVTLNMDPGTIVFATGASFLAVNRGNQINAVGTATQPIIFTGRGNVTGETNDQSSQLWGGIVLLGRAPITDCLAPTATPGTVDCSRDTEGTSNAFYGGATPGDSSGRMSYVQIRYSGFILSAASELQGLTPSGTGSGTQIDHIQVHNSSDDGIEVFGGRTNMRYLVLTGNEDDSLDTDVGYKGNIQFVLTVQRANANVGDSMLEIDSNPLDTQIPRQNVRLANFTFIQRSTAGANGTAALIRGGADYWMINGLFVTPPGVSCIRIDAAATAQPANPAQDEQGPPRFDSVLLSGCSTALQGRTNVTDAQALGFFTAGTNNNAAFTSSLTNVFVNGPNETAAVAANPATLTGETFFTATNYVGAVRDANDTWYRNWTCNSATADFGSAGGQCSTIPTT